MSGEEFKGLGGRVAKQMVAWQVENLKVAMAAEWDSIAYWESRIETLERYRERYNKKRGWSAEDIDAVDGIDDEIRVCEDNIQRLEDGDWDDDVAEVDDAVGVEAY